jgi:hypothetical protein
MVGKPSPQNPLISQLTLPPETITSCSRRIRQLEFQPHSGRHPGFSPAGDGYRDYQKRAKAPIPRGKCEDNHRSSIPEDWVVEVVGLELETHHAVIEPVSACAGNGNFRCRDGGSKIRLFPRRETDTETTRSGQKPPFGAENAKTPTQVRYLETGWWAHQGSNLGSDD